MAASWYLTFATSGPGMAWREAAAHNLGTLSMTWPSTAKPARQKAPGVSMSDLRSCTAPEAAEIGSGPPKTTRRDAIRFASLLLQRAALVARLG